MGSYNAYRTRSREEKEAKRLAQMAEAEKEEERLNSLTLTERIYECGDIHDIKRVLLIIAERLEND